MEERKEFMISPTGNGNTLLCNGNTLLHNYRTAHFIIPTLVTSIHAAVEPPPPQNPTGVSAYKDLPFKVIFRGWRHPTKKWESWVHQMHSLHHETWKKAGIFNAIMSSIYNIHRKDDLIFGFSEKWCPKTNSFVCPWGEATVTLEDIMILGGYSVLGESILIPRGESEMEEKIKKLLSERTNICRTRAKKADQSAWMSIFMDNNNSEIEHEAFLVYWLSRFVFPITSRNTIGQGALFSIAVCLARGVKIALAPAVLASVYRSLSLLKSILTSARKRKNVGTIAISAPLALVQVWVFERFPSLRPEPNSVKPSEPRLARWHNLKKVVAKDISLAIESAAESFEWRPYMKYVDNVFTRKIYKDNEYWAFVDTDLDEDLEGLVRCLRMSELVGLEPDCIEQYLPHRVAMQFGMDQDIPCHVARANENTDIACTSYNSPIVDSQLYVPSRLFEPGVTTRYFKWWKDSVEREAEEDDLIPISKLSRDRRNGNFVSQEVVKRQSTLSSTSNEAEDGSCEKGGFKSSEIISIASDSSADSSLISGSAPKSKRKRGEEYSEDSSDSKQFQDSKSKKIVAQRIGKRQKSPISSEEAENGSSCGKGSSFKSSERSDSSTGPIAPPPGFATLHSNPVKAWDSSSEIFGNKCSQDNAKGKFCASSTEDNGNIQEVISLLEPPESEIKNTSTKENHVHKGTTEELWEGLEKRVSNLEKLYSLLKQGKLDYLLLKNPNKP